MYGPDGPKIGQRTKKYALSWAEPAAMYMLFVLKSDHCIFSKNILEHDAFWYHLCLAFNHFWACDVHHRMHFIFVWQFGWVRAVNVQPSEFRELSWRGLTVLSLLVQRSSVLFLLSEWEQTIFLLLNSGLCPLNYTPWIPESIYHPFSTYYVNSTGHRLLLCMDPMGQK